MTSEESSPVRGKHYELVPPDGGWGYVICIAATINFIAMTSFMSSFGIIFNDVFIELGMGTTDVSLLAGINALSAAVAGFLAGPLLKVLSMRKLAFVASVIFNSGVLGTVFVNTKVQLFFCQGILQNFGIGLLYNLSCSALNDYFKQKRLISMSVVNFVTALGAMVAPMVVDWSTAKFKLHGTLLLISAIGSLTFVGSALMQPVAWHMKMVQVEEEPITPEKMLLLKLSQIEKEDEELKSPEKADDFPEEKNDENRSEGNAALLNYIKSYFDWPLLKEYLCTAACFGIPIAMFTDTTYTYFLPQYLYDRNWSHASVAWAFSLQAFGDIATRVMLIFSSSILKILGSHLLYVIGVVVGIVTKIALLWVSDHTTMLVIIGIMGISRCTITVLFPLVVSDSVRPELFPSAFGFSMLMFGLSSIVMGPITGAIRDATADYATMFLILISLLVAIAVAMSFEVVIRRRKQSKQEKKSKDLNNKV